MKNRKAVFAAAAALLCATVIFTACKESQGKTDTDGETTARGVYIAGAYGDDFSNIKACYWKDGERTDLAHQVPAGTEPTLFGIAVVE